MTAKDAQMKAFYKRMKRILRKETFVPLDSV